MLAGLVLGAAGCGGTSGDPSPPTGATSAGSPSAGAGGHGPQQSGGAGGEAAGSGGSGGSGGAEASAGGQAGSHQGRDCEAAGDVIVVGTGILQGMTGAPLSSAAVESLLSRLDVGGEIAVMNRE